MIGLLLVYALCLTSGVCLERRLPLNHLVERTVMVITFAAAQMMAAIQMLSLLGRLTGFWMILAHIPLTALIVAWNWVKPGAAGRLSWMTLLARAREQLATNRGVAILAVFALVILAAYCALGALMIPIGDIYHFEMPLYWRQNRSIAPFPINNPRVAAISFLGEALAFPGYLYCGSGAMFVALTGMAGLLAVAVVFLMAREMGCGVGASACGALLVLGFPDFAKSFLELKAAHYLVAMWMGASLLFLTRATSRPAWNRKDPGAGGAASAGEYSPELLGGLGCSLFCFLMACGAKNTTLLLGPVYLIALFLSLKAGLLRMPILRVLVLWGSIALLCSGAPWNYIQNKLWYGDAQGPQFLRQTVSRDFSPGAVWTRLARGAVLTELDPIWVPRSVQRIYGRCCARLARVLGGRETLIEDNESYGFREETITPCKGCGLVGMLLLAPGLIVAAGRSVRPGPARQAIRLQLLFLLGTFVVIHAVMRWQSIGLLRLMPGFPALGAPVCALVLRGRWRPVFAGLLLAGSSLMFLTLDLSMIGRRFDAAANSPVLKAILGLGRDHTVELEYKWTGQPSQRMSWREDYTSREMVRTFLAGAHEPAVIGFIGGPDSESYYLFGKDFGNRVIALRDIRNPTGFLEPPDDVEYIVSVEYTPDQGTWAERRHYNRVFEVTRQGVCLLAAFKKVNQSR